MPKQFKKISLFFNALFEGKSLEQTFKKALYTNNINYIKEFIDTYPKFFTQYDKKKNSVPFVFALTSTSSFEVMELLIQAHIDNKINLSFDKIQNNNILNYFANSHFPQNREKTLVKLLEIPEIKQMVSQNKKGKILNSSVYEYAVGGRQSLEFFNILLSVDNTQFLNNSKLVQLIIEDSRDDLLTLLIQKNHDYMIKNQETFCLMAAKKPDIKIFNLLFELDLPSEEMLKKIQHTTNSLSLSMQSSSYLVWINEKDNFFSSIIEKIKAKQEKSYLEQSVDDTPIHHTTKKHHHKL